MVCQFLSSLTNLSNMKIKCQFPWCFQIQVLHLRYCEDENSAYEAKSILTTSFCVETILKVHLLLRHIFKFRANSKKSEYFENCRRHENRQKAFQKCMAFKFSGMSMQFGNTVTESRHLHFVKILFLRSKVRILRPSYCAKLLQNKKFGR